MRVFFKNSNYLGMTPNITWDDSFVPPELYDDTELVIQKGNGKEEQNGKGKTKETAHNKEKSDDGRKNPHE